MLTSFGQHIVDRPSGNEVMGVAKKSKKAKKAKKSKKGKK
jgi:hypothetical protein